jgi:DNA repair exonuclease SbcCD ATPase subunit
MIPKRVTLENFLSFGLKTEIAFTDDEPLWVVGGPNGVGKSAVFDAITFCLFGAHRGGAKEIDPLVRHGANGFSVAFEFEFGGVDYRITRNRVGNKTTQAVEQRRPDAAKWERVPNVNSVPQVREWAEKTLGLGFDAFKASVLLRQGEADAIITATGAERLKILKKIIGAERFEDLSKRVHDATRTNQGLSEQFSRQLEQTPEVTEEERATAGRVLAERDEARQAARDAETDVAARVEQARQWVALDGQLAELNGRIRAADERRASAVAIRDRHARLVDLEAAVPVVRELVTLRDSRTGTDAAVTALRQAHHDQEGKQQSAARAAAAARDLAEQHRVESDAAETAVRDLEQRLKDDRNNFSTAEEVARVDGELALLPATLDELLRAAETESSAAEVEADAAKDRRSAVAALLDRREGELAEFETVEIGARCSRCLQPVSAEHAERERAELLADIRRLRTAVAAAGEVEKDANARSRRAKEEQGRLTRAATTRDNLTTKRLTLLRHGEVPSATALRERIREAESELNRQQKRLNDSRKARKAAIGAVDEHDAERLAAEAELKVTGDKLKAAEGEQIRADARRAALVGTLRGDWATRWESLTAEAAAALADELQTLSGSSVREDFRRLTEDDARRGEWEERRTGILSSIEAIPPESRISVATATAAVAAARKAAADRTVEWDAARKTFDEQTARIERRAALREQARKAETDARIHSKLDDLLGRTGLQRELVRDAETQIVRLAHDTVRHLSDGDLSIELDAADEGGDEAFALRVRRADDPTPIGVAYLSGSQKFRVAISVALAIGRFAAGQARPLECVIIDEGFGSLDKDGLRAAADELNRLKQYLRRIVLVSHQEEFTDQFPVVIRLTKGEAGTTAEAVRR